MHESLKKYKKENRVSNGRKELSDYEKMIL